MILSDSHDEHSGNPGSDHEGPGSEARGDVSKKDVFPIREAWTLWASKYGVLICSAQPPFPRSRADRGILVSLGSESAHIDYVSIIILIALDDPNQTVVLTKASNHCARAEDFEGYNCRYLDLPANRFA